MLPYPWPTHDNMMDECADRPEERVTIPTLILGGVLQGLSRCLTCVLIKMKWSRFYIFNREGCSNSHKICRFIRFSDRKKTNYGKREFFLMLSELPAKVANDARTD